MSTASSTVTAVGALEHVATVVLHSDTDEVKAFCLSCGINDINDFMSATENDFNMSYSTIADPGTSLFLSSFLMKKLLSLQIWYASQPVYELRTWYSLTHEMHLIPGVIHKMFNAFNPLSWFKVQLLVPLHLVL
jgi:hypothetical protein